MQPWLLVFLSQGLCSGPGCLVGWLPGTCPCRGQSPAECPVSLPLTPTFGLRRSEESKSNKCFLIMQIFRARKPAEMATPSAVPMRAYLMSEG